MLLPYFTLLFLSGICNLPTLAEDRCRSTSPLPYAQFATKTPYAYIAKNLDNSKDGLPEFCTPEKFWTLVRHGTRYPSKKAINFMNKELLDLQGIILSSNNSHLCSEDRKALAEWEPFVKVSQAKDLHAEGELEMIGIAERFQNRFPNILDIAYSPEDFLFRTTATQRARQSAKFYATGLFSRPVANRVHYREQEGGGHDPLIRQYKLCKRWITEVKKSNSSRQEFHKFSSSDWITAVRRNVTNFLGLESMLSPEDVDRMYVTCTFEEAWRPSTHSPWCGVLSSSHLEVMEYREDLEYYWVDGPGYPINSVPACVLMKDVINKFSSSTKGQKGEKGIFYFSHSGTVLKLLAYLGLFRGEDHMASHQYQGLGYDWPWRTSRISPFAANIAIVLATCTGNTTKSTGSAGKTAPQRDDISPGEGVHGESSGFRVGIYVNEELVLVPGCSEKWCAWEQLAALFPPKNCDQDQLLCDVDTDEGDLSVADDKY